MAKYERTLYVTENGIADAEDTLRPKFIEDHIESLGKGGGMRRKLTFEATSTGL
jgi:beta-glucosidase/6-phospho-beta-glucosidase/beta-galactosidase